MIQIWTEQRGDGVKLFHRTGEEEAKLIAIGSHEGVWSLIKKDTGRRLEGCCGSPTIYWDVVLNTRGKEILKDLEI